MITKITTENQTQIQEAIHANGQGAITGDILQEKMLLLNRDLFGGQIEYDTRFRLSDIENAVIQGAIPEGTLMTFFQEWLAGAKGDWETWKWGELQNTFLPLYNSVGGTFEGQVVGYMRMATNATEQEINCSLILSGSKIREFTIWTNGPTLSGNYIMNVKYLLSTMFLDLPNENKTYNTLSDMLDELYTSESEIHLLLEGRVTSIYTSNSKMYSVDFLDVNQKIVKVGYYHGASDFECWTVNFKLFTVTYSAS